MNALNAAYATCEGVAGATSLNFDFKPDGGGNYDGFDGPNDSAGPAWFDGTGGTLDQEASWRYANIVVGGWLPEDYFLNLGSANILAVTWTGKLSGDGSRKPAWRSEIFFNEGFEWSTDSSCSVADPLFGTCFDIETVFLHELGHAIGFGHEDTVGVDSIMASFYDGTNSVLYQTDIDGAVALYSNPLKGGGKGGGNGGRGGKKNKLGALEADFNSIAVPEPGTLAMFGFGLAALGLLRRRRAV